MLGVLRPIGLRRCQTVGAGWRRNPVSLDTPPAGRWPASGAIRMRVRQVSSSFPHCFPYGGQLSFFP